MRKLALIVIVLFAGVGFSYGQGGLGNAIMAYDAGKLDQAKQAIDEAVKHPKASTKSKTWYYYGKIYAGIASDITGLFINLDKDATHKAYEGYKKAMELEPDKKGYYQDAKKEMEQLFAISLNRAVGFYEEKDIDNALRSLELALLLQPQDTTALIYSAAMAYEAGNVDKYITYTRRYLSLEDVPYERKARQYQDLIIILANEKKDLDAAIELAKEGMEASSGQDARYYELIAALYEQKEEVDQALEYYIKGADLFPDNYILNGNAGLGYYNRAVRMAEEMEDLGNKLKDAEIKERIAKIDAELKKALPYLERAHQIKPDEKVFMDVLARVYARLKMRDKAEAMEKKLKSM